jgi:hypothetical protein
MASSVGPLADLSIRIVLPQSYSSVWKGYRRFWVAAYKKKSHSNLNNGIGMTTLDESL